MMVNGYCVVSFLTTAFLIAAASPELLGSGQWQVGVSLKLHGATIPNNSLVDIDDLLYTGGSCCKEPSNARPELHNQALLCVTDLEDCCESPHTVRGDWHYPDGRTVQYDAWGSTFRRSRGPNEVRDGKQFYGSVRLYRRYNRPPERGRFRCELPTAADPSVNQTLYANILDFGMFNPVTISFSGSNMAGESYSLMCSATLFDPIPLPSDVPSPIFEWLFGSNGNASSTLPSGVTPVASISSNTSTSITYTSTLQFSPLSQSHGGIYTCRLGAGRLANTTVIIVNEPTISAQITLASLLGGYSITCNVNGAENLNHSISYQWTKNNDTQLQMQIESDPTVPSLTLLRLSDVGQYTCEATICSPYLHDNITMIAIQHVTIQIPSPISVMVSSNILNPIRPVGSAVTLICTVEYSPAVTVDIPVIMNTVWTGPAGFMATNIAVQVDATTYVSIMLISSFGIEQSGNYTCAATISSKYTNSFLSDSNRQSGTTWVGTIDQSLGPEMSCTCFREAIVAVGVLVLMEGIITIIIVVVYSYRFIKRRKSGKNNINLSINTAYDEVKLGAIGGGQGDSEYEDPYTLTRSGHRQENYVPVDNESSVSKLEGPVYATVDQ